MTSNTMRTAAAKAKVGQCNSSSPSTNDRIWSRNSSPSTETPVTLPNWLPIMMTATPVMYPISTGCESRSARNPNRTRPATKHIAPDDQRGSRCQRRVSPRIARGQRSECGRGHQCGRRLRTDGQLPRGAKHRIDGQRRQARPTGRRRAADPRPSRRPSPAGRGRPRP